MNLQWLHDEVAKILDADVSFCIGLDVWDHRRAADGLNVEVAIWDGHRHFAGPTPQAALDQLKLAYNIPAGSELTLSAVVVPVSAPSSTSDPVEA